MKIFKALSIVLSIAVMPVFALIGWGDATIPDEIFITSDSPLNVSEVFTCEIVGAREAAVSASGEGEYTLNVSLLNTIPVKASRMTVSERKYVVVGGTIIGLKLFTEGVAIVGIDEVATADGTVSPASQAGLGVGDSIVSIDSVKVSTTAQVAKILSESGGKPMLLSVKRESKVFETYLQPVLSVSDGTYKAGLWVRDSAAGIGTMTYYDRNSGVYASLGHAVCDVDTGKVISVADGECVSANITGCYKGSNGSAGELCGVFGTESLGTLTVNGKHGAYGLLSKVDNTAVLTPVATASEVQTGYAQIISTVDASGPQLFDIEITKLYKLGSQETRNMAITVTDKQLIDLTGGIVQGMSGSPIIQNGMLVGAVTHVFVNDPLQGYAIYAESMVEISDSIVSETVDNAA